MNNNENIMPINPPYYLAHNKAAFANILHIYNNPFFFLCIALRLFAGSKTNR